MFNLKNRRYIGNKSKLLDWIYEHVNESCEGTSFFDIFAGTGVVSEKFLSSHKEIILNDFLYSNEVIFHSFFRSNNIDYHHLRKLSEEISTMAQDSDVPNYFDRNFGGKFFSVKDARTIGLIREKLNELLITKQISRTEFYVLLSSLIYSTDKIANTVGHYDAYRKVKEIKDKFSYKLIQNLDTKNNNIQIFREDANSLAKQIRADVVFVDPPYNSRQYSRFYHVLENLVEWKKPKLSGIALKPNAENMSEYSKSKAKVVFANLIENLNSNYIAVTYNNTYKSKSSSSRNKITLNELTTILKQKGPTKVFSKEHRFFNSGKTTFNDHKEVLFITKVSQ